MAMEIIYKYICLVDLEVHGRFRSTYAKLGADVALLRLEIGGTKD
jgi:hypothetical protein